MMRSAPSTPPLPRSPQPARSAPGGPADAGIRLREMRWWDIDPVLALERDLFPDDAWSRGMFWSELAHARGPGASRRYVVAEAAGRLLGYAGLAASGDLADVQTIAVVREQWGTGLGARLLTDLLRHATAAECTEVMLEVRVDNTRAQRLYERFGFEPVGIRRGYYQPGSVDALVMRLLVHPTSDEDPPAPLDGNAAAATAEPARPAASENPAAGTGATDATRTADTANTANTADIPGTADAAARQERQGPETHG